VDKGISPVQDDPAVICREISSHEIRAESMDHLQGHAGRALDEVTMFAMELAVVNNVQIQMATFFWGKMRSCSHHLQSIMQR